MTFSKKYFTLISCAIGLLTLMPIAALFFYTFFPNGQFSTGSLRAILENNKTYFLLIRSLKLGLWVVIGTTAIAFPLALITTKTFFSRYRWLDVLFTLPFMTPPYIGAMGWILFMQKNGFLVQLFPKLAFLSQFFFSVFGMVFIMSLHLFPTLYLMIKNSMLQLEGSFQDAAKIYGKNSLLNWFKISLPLLIPSYLLGALLIFVKTLSEFGTPITFGTRIGYKVFTTEIHANLSSWPVNIPKAATLSFLLFFICLLIWLIQIRVIQKFVYGTVSATTRQPTLVTKRWLLICAWVFLLLVILFSIVIPYFTILVTSLMAVRGNGLRLDNLSFAAYTGLLKNQQGGLSAFLNSLYFAILTAIITSLLGFFAGIYIHKAQKRGQKVVDFIGLMPNIIPGIVLVVGLIIFWNNPWLPFSVYNTKAMVILTYSALFIPYSIQYVKNNVMQINESIFEATKVFSKNQFQTFFNIYFPLLKRGLLTGAMMTFIISMRELVGSLLILPPGVETSATYIYRQFEQGNVSSGMAMAMITILMTLIFVTFIEKSKK